jgi:hypothetical protein
MARTFWPDLSTGLAASCVVTNHLIIFAFDPEVIQDRYRHTACGCPDRAGGVAFQSGLPMLMVILRNFEENRSVKSDGISFAQDVCG